MHKERLESGGWKRQKLRIHLIEEGAHQSLFLQQVTKQPDGFGIRDATGEVQSQQIDGTELVHNTGDAPALDWGRQCLPTPLRRCLCPASPPTYFPQPIR